MAFPGEREARAKRVGRAPEATHRAMSLGHYALEKVLHDGPTFTLYRGRDERDGAAVVLKMLAPERATASAAAALRREHAFLCELIDLPGVVKPLAFCEHAGVLALVLADESAEDLALYLARRRPPLEELLSTAAELAETLHQVHTRSIIHKDINPRNIVITAARRVQLIDFGLSTRLPREVQELRSPNVLEGTLPYISPEQTGRMNQAIDYRTDLYSFGATLYEMLTGRPPFKGGDALALVHAHIAKVPDPPHAIEPGIPEAVSRITLKLLEKSVEDRYQSALGLKADLEECLRQLRGAGTLQTFTLAQHDFSGRFQIPERLYGRDAELDALNQAFERVCQGARELVLVAGASGIGKSAVVRELYKALAQQGGFLVSGKFEELRRDVPYSALLAAMRELCRYLLAESEASLARIRRELRAAVGNIGQVLVDVIPELGLILGETPQLEELPPAASRNRFSYAFRRLLRALSPTGAPLVLFLDDLQWADAASLDLLSGVLAEPDAGCLLFIGAYREGEVDGAHPLLRALASIEESGRAATRIALGPLRVESVTAMIADTTAAPREEARGLAEIVVKKTHGNPFFVSQLLTSLQRSGVISPDLQRRRWTWDLARVEGAPSTDNVIELMAARAGALSAPTQDALRWAACIGARFDLAALAAASGGPAERAETALGEAVEAGLVVSLGAGAYRFLHDRVEEAIYLSISEQARADMHHRLARLLMERHAAPGRAPADDSLFELLRHANLARSLFSEDEARVALARLNLAAGQRARAAGALDPASAYYTSGLYFLPEDAWTRLHDVAFALHLGAAEGESYAGRLTEAERLFEVLHREANDAHERATLHELKSGLYVHHARLQQALDEVLAGLDQLGIRFPPRPGKSAVSTALRAAQQALGERSPEDLLSLPALTDPHVKLALRLLKNGNAAAFQLDRTLHTLLTLRSLTLSVEHGASSLSGLSYITYGVILGTHLGDLERQVAFGRAALSILERYPDKSLETYVKTAYGGSVHPFGHAIRSGFTYLQEAYEAGLEAGDLNYPSYAQYFRVALSLIAGLPLPECLSAADVGLSFARRVGNVLNVLFITAIRQSVLALQGLTKGTGRFDTDDFDERAFVDRISRIELKHPLQTYRGAKLRVLYVLGCYEEAAALATLTRAAAEEMMRTGLVAGAETCFYASLAHVAACASAPPAERKALLLGVRRSQRMLARWAESAPMNFRHKHLLVEAELARIAEKDRAAMQHYEAAIVSARENQVLSDEALALELAARFFLSRGLRGVGDIYLAQARRAYARWGASAKVALLDQAYPGLSRSALRTADTAGWDTSTASTRGEVALDAPSIIKASQALSREIGLARLLSELIRIVTENAGAERGALLLRREAGGELRVEAEISPERGAIVLSPPAPLGEGQRASLAIVQVVARTQESVVLGDATRAGPFTKDAYVQTRQPRSVLCMPIVHQGETKGVLYLENNLTAGAFTEDRVALLRVVCAQMAISVDNALLYANLEQKVLERTRELREAQARLVQLEREATELQMAGGFAHEMRNALNGASLLLRAAALDDEGVRLPAASVDIARQLFMEVKGALQPEVGERVAGHVRALCDNARQLDELLAFIEDALKRALGITNRILEYSSIGRTGPGTDVLAVRPIVVSVLDEMREDLAGHGINVLVEVPEELAWLGKLEHLQTVVRHLVSNARNALVDVVRDGGRRIRVAAEMRAESVVLRVEDTGTGIELAHRAKVFQPFFSTNPADGVGLGLGLVQKIASLYDGAIDFETEVGRGTVFTVVLPRGGERACPPSAPIARGRDLEPADHRAPRVLHIIDP